MRHFKANPLSLAAPREITGIRTNLARESRSNAVFDSSVENEYRNGTHYFIADPLHI